MSQGLTTIQTNENTLIKLWLSQQSIHTRRAYEREVKDFLNYVRKPLALVTLYDLQSFAEDVLPDLVPSSQARAMYAVKSLLSFAHETGYLPVNVGKAWKAPKVRSRLAERILSEEKVIKLIALETNNRNHALLRLLYLSGIRVSEATSLKWRDVQARENGRGQIAIWGKGEKERFVLLSAEMYAELLALREYASDNDPVFRSRKIGSDGTYHLSQQQVDRILIDAAKRAGIDGNVSAHWLRHACASHSLDRGAPISLVQETLGHSSLATTSKYTHARPGRSISEYLPL